MADIIFILLLIAIWGMFILIADIHFETHTKSCIKKLKKEIEENNLEMRSTHIHR